LKRIKFSFHVAIDNKKANNNLEKLYNLKKYFLEVFFSIKNNKKLSFSSLTIQLGTKNMLCSLKTFKCPQIKLGEALVYEWENNKENH